MLTSNPNKLSTEPVTVLKSRLVASKEKMKKSKIFYKKVLTNDIIFDII